MKEADTVCMCPSHRGTTTIPLRDVVLLQIERSLPALSHRHPQIIYARQHLLELVIQVMRKPIELLERD